MPAVVAKASFQPLPPSLDVDRLVEANDNFTYVKRIQVRDIGEEGLDAFERLVIEHVVVGGKPLVIEGLDKVLSKSIFSVKWLEEHYGAKHENARDLTNQEDLDISISHYLKSLVPLTDQFTEDNFDDAGRERLYLKDIDCPDEWHEEVRSKLMPSVFYLNESTGLSGGPGSREDTANGTPGKGVAPAGDLMSSLPPEMRAENLMCYIGHEGTYTPAHREMCATLGQNIMVETSGSELDPWGQREKPGSSLWFMTETKDRYMVAEYWMAVLGHAIEVESHFAQLVAWRMAPFTTYIVEQKLGDFILIPPLAPHQVWNCGTRTMKVAWNRTTVETLDWALSDALPNARMVCRDEQYKNKAIIYFTLIKYAEDLRRVVALLAACEPESATAQEIKHDRHIRQLRKDFRRLFEMFTDILLSEKLVTRSHKSPLPELEYVAFDSNVTCAYCRCNIFNRFLTCPKCVIELEDGSQDSYDVCMECYAMGRSCACLNAYKWVEQFPWGDLVQNHRDWRQLIIDLEDRKIRPVTVEDAYTMSNKRTLASVCLEALQTRNPKDLQAHHRLREKETEDVSGESANEDLGSSSRSKKRRSKKGSKKADGDIYNCHICKHREIPWKLAVCDCGLAYCYGVLYRAFDLMPLQVMQQWNWQCPRCLNNCSCGACRRTGTTNPYYPIDTQHGHDTKSIADHRSIEALVDFGRANVDWIRKSNGEDEPASSHETLRLQRLKAEAESEKKQGYVLPPNWYAFDDSASDGGEDVAMADSSAAPMSEDEDAPHDEEEDSADNGLTELERDPIGFMERAGLTPQSSPSHLPASLQSVDPIARMQSSTASDEPPARRTAKKPRKARASTGTRGSASKESKGSGPVPRVSTERRQTRSSAAARGSASKESKGSGPVHPITGAPLSDSTERRMTRRSTAARGSAFQESKTPDRVHPAPNASSSPDSSPPRPRLRGHDRPAIHRHSPANQEASEPSDDAEAANRKYLQTRAHVVLETAMKHGRFVMMEGLLLGLQMVVKLSVPRWFLAQLENKPLAEANADTTDRLDATGLEDDLGDDAPPDRDEDGPNAQLGRDEDGPDAQLGRDEDGLDAQLGRDEDPLTIDPRYLLRDFVAVDDDEDGDSDARSHRSRRLWGGLDGTSDERPDEDDESARDQPPMNTQLTPASSIHDLPPASRSMAAPPSVPVRRGPGRPRKVQPPTSTDGPPTKFIHDPPPASGTMAAPPSVPLRRGPGRPRKVQPPTLDETQISGVGDRGNTGNQDSAGLGGHSASAPTSSVHDPPPAPGSMAAPAGVPPRRGPGRPRKVQPPTLDETPISGVGDRGNTSNQDSAGLVGHSASTPTSSVHDPPPASGSMAAPASVPPRRGPGRPRKVQPPTLDETPISGVGDRGNTGNQDSAGLVGHSASTPTSSVHDPPPASGSMAAPASVPPRRGPGRPRKVQPPTPTDGPPTKFTTTKVSKVLDRGNTGNTDSPGLSASTPASARSAGPMTRARRGSPMPDPPDGTDLYAPLRRKYRKRSSLANEVTPASANAGAGKSAAPDKATPDAGSDEGVKLAQKLNQLADKILSAHSSVFASAASDRASQPSPSLGETSSDGPARMSPYDALVELRRTPLDVFLADERNPRPSILDLPLSAGTDSALDMALDSEPRPSLFDAALKVVADAALDLGVDPQRRPSSSVAPLPPAPPTVADPLDPTAPAHAVAADPVTRERPPPTRSQKPKPPAAANTAADPTDRAYLDAKLMARRVADGEVSDIASDVDAPDSPPAERDVRRSRRSRRHRRSRSLSLSIPVLKPRPRTDVQPYRGGPLLAADRGTAVTDQGSPARTLRTRWTFGDDDDAPVRARVWAQHDRESATIDRGRTSKRRHHLLSDEDDHVDVDVNDDEEEEDLPPPLPPRANGALAGSIFGRPGVAGRMIRIVGAPSRRGRYAQEEEEDEDEDVEMEME